MKKYILFLTVMATSMANMAAIAGECDGYVNGMCYKLKHNEKLSSDVDEYELKCGAAWENVYYYSEKRKWCDSKNLVGFGFCNEDFNEFVKEFCTRKNKK